jgi:hypothetical protein
MKHGICRPGLSLCDIVFYVVYDIVYVEGIASRLGPSVEQVAFPFDATKRAKITIRTPNNIIEQNIVELSCSPLVLGIRCSSERLAPTVLASRMVRRRIRHRRFNYDVVYDVVGVCQHYT